LVVIVEARNVVFLGSSSEALPAATILKALLEEADISARLWNDVFEPSEIILDRLLEEATTAQYGVFIFSSDDAATIRGKRFSAPRDNVVFEAGMFMGVKGRSHVFIIVPKDDPRNRILSDIAGLVCLTYTTPREHSAAAWRVALSQVASALVKNIAADRTKTRIRALDGLWQGHTFQRYSAKGQPKRRSIQGRFVVRDEAAHGHFFMPGSKLPNSDRDLELILIGKLLFDSFFKLDYVYPDLGPIQFGSAVLELNAAGSRLKGEFVGYGAIAQRILSGTLQLDKAAGPATKTSVGS
jgi:predicted nucleotide-binding protein with TIR-like domain